MYHLLMITIFCTNIEQGLPNISKTFYKTEQPLWMASLMHICVLNSTHISIQRKRRAKYSVSRWNEGQIKKRTVVLSRLSSSWREMLKIICYSWVRVKKCKEILQLFHIWPKHSFIVKAAFVAFPPLFITLSMWVSGTLHLRIFHNMPHIRMLMSNLHLAFERRRHLSTMYSI